MDVFFLIIWLRKRFKSSFTSAGVNFRYEKLVLDDIWLAATNFSTSQLWCCCCRLWSGVVDWLVKCCIQTLILLCRSLVWKRNWIKSRINCLGFWMFVFRFVLLLLALHLKLTAVIKTFTYHGALGCYIRFVRFLFNFRDLLYWKYAFGSRRKHVRFGAATWIMFSFLNSCKLIS